MDRKRIYLVTSCKGGVGKSTFAVNLAMTLALSGQNVLLADCDLKNRTADLLLGYEDAGMFDLYDVSEGRAEPEEAILADPRCSRLYFTAVPSVNAGVIDPCGIADAAVRCADAVRADFLIIDTSGGIEFPTAVYEELIYEAIIVSTPSSPSIRAAAKTAGELSAVGVKNMSLVINSFGRKNDFDDIIKMIDESRVPLLGIVPYDAKMKAGQEQGKPAAAVEGCSSPDAFYNISQRLLGRDVPLLSGVKL